MALKQVIVMRTDLNMRKGKMVSQGAHASEKGLFDKGHVLYYHDREYFCIPLDEHNKDWIVGDVFKKIVCRVDSEKELVDLYKRVTYEIQAQGLTIAHGLIEDSGLTEFHGVKTITCASFGPCEESWIDQYTGHLPLL